MGGISSNGNVQPGLQYPRQPAICSASFRSPDLDRARAHDGNREFGNVRGVVNNTTAHAQKRSTVSVDAIDVLGKESTKYFAMSVPGSQVEEDMIYINEESSLVLMQALSRRGKSQ